MDPSDMCVSVCLCCASGHFAVTPSLPRPFSAQRSFSKFRTFRNHRQGSSTDQRKRSRSKVGTSGSPAPQSTFQSMTLRKLPIRPVAPRFHILGPGGIGSLFAYYFYQNHIPFTFFQRRAPPPTPSRHFDSHANQDSNIDHQSHRKDSKSHMVYPPTTLKYMNLTSLETTSAEPQVIDGLDWEPLYPIIDKELFRYDPVYNELSRSPIHQLLVTTKTYQTVEAISKIRHRLRPWTTIVLMQNGMGVREEICERMGWKDERERPNFVQGIISHGAQKIDDTIVHTGRGHVWLAPIVEAVAGSGSGASIKTLLKRDLETPSIFPQLQKPAKQILSTPYPSANPARFVAPFTDDPFSSFYVAPSSSKELQDLRTRSLYETLSAFQELSAAMELKILMPEHLLALQLSKLVVNACVNPVATLLEATNGALLDPVTDEAHQAVKDLLRESHAILSHSKEYEALDESLKQEFLTLEALTKTTEEILRATRQNQCSTLQDYLKGSQQCEIEYMNGYLIKMAERNSKGSGVGVETVAPLNRMVTERIKEKFSAPRKAID